MVGTRNEYLITAEDEDEIVVDALQLIWMPELGLMANPFLSADEIQPGMDFRVLVAVECCSI